MAQSKIYVDTNIYLRLAQTISPLLFQPFCPEEFTLYITHRFQSEYDRKPRLREKFNWVNNQEYVENRAQKIYISRSQKEDIRLAIGYISDHNIRIGLGVQEVDIDILSHALVLEMPVATDDGDMTTLANGFGIEVWNSIKLMRVMLDCAFVQQSEIDAVVNYMHYMEDLPWPRYISDYAAEFPDSELKEFGKSRRRSKQRA